MTRRALLALAVLPVLAAATAAPPKPGPPPPPGGIAIQLANGPRSPDDRLARQLMAQDIGAGAKEGERALVLTARAPLGTASDRPALFIQLQSERECGSGGCDTTVYLWQNGAWKRVLDGVGGHLVAGPGRTAGMADLTTEKARYAWTGTEYRDTNPVPMPDLRPRR